jgi:hypothetical protein
MKPGRKKQVRLTINKVVPFLMIAGMVFIVGGVVFGK